MHDDAAGGPALRALGRVVSALAAVGMALAASGLLISFVLIGWAVVMRYAFNAAPIWVDEVVGFLLVAIVLLAAAQTLRRGEHIGVDLLTDRLSARSKRWTSAWAALATGIIAGVLIVNGWETASLARRLGLLTEGSLEWPTWWLMLLMPVGGTLLLLAAVEALWRTVVGAPPLRAPAHGEADAE
ncbi:MAG: TRAP transporter small permease [Rhizobacter sp.]|nr:TRAP transporter small permease [Rhizobacter sp.]